MEHEQAQEGSQFELSSCECSYIDDLSSLGRWDRAEIFQVFMAVDKNRDSALAVLEQLSDETPQVPEIK
jgi:hypothetical protein